MFFCQKIVKIFVFPKVFSKIYVRQEQSVRQLCWFCKKCTCFRKIFAKTEKVGSFLQDIFLKGLNIWINTFCVGTDGFPRSFKSFSVPYTSINFLFASLKLLTETLLRFPFSVIGQSYIYLGSSVCLSSCHIPSCRPVIFLSSCHSCGTLSYSLCFRNQTDQGNETEGFEVEGLEMER